MEKRVSILFIFMLIFQTISGGLGGIVASADAEGKAPESNVLTLESVKDENGKEVDPEGEFKEDLVVELTIGWTASEANEELSRILSDLLVIENSQEGVLTVEEDEVGTYQVDTGGNITVAIGSDIEPDESLSGEFNLQALVEANVEVDVDAEKEEGNAEEETVTNESEDNQELIETQNKDVTNENEKNQDAVNSEDGTQNLDENKKNEKDILAEEHESQKITENIIDELKLFYEDGTEYQDGDFIEIGEDLKFEIDWSLPNGHEYKHGDTFEFQLPKQLQVHNADSGSLGDYGTYEVTLDGKVTFTFNERIENESNIKGEFWFDTELEEQEIKSTNEHLEIIFNDDVAKKITINVKPTDGQAIHKQGQPVDGNFNTEEIQWTVIVNTTRDDLKNAIVHDPILEGQVLDLDSIELQEVEVDLSGNITEELDVVTDFTNNSTEEELNIALGDTNKAYKLTFKTKITEDEKDKEGWLWYSNTAYLNSDGQEEKQSGAGVSVERPESLVKSSSAFDEEDRSVEWEVKANFTEKQLKAGDTIVDEFTFKVGDNELNDVFEIIEEDIEILQVNSFDNNGNPDETISAKDLFDIDIDGNKVTYTLKEDSNNAFILKYKTQAKDGSYITDDGTIFNKVEIDGKTDDSSQGVIQQVGKKANAGIDYENKTIDWTITINADKQDLRNFVLTDDFSGSGQKLVDGSIKIDPSISEDKITPNEDGEGFVIDFGDITDTYTITYQTEFTYDFEGEKTPNFKNGVDITYTTSDEGPEYELEIGNEVPPNKETKSNGAKNGTANNETKEITWTVDINYNQLELEDAKLIDEIAENQLLVDGSVKIYPTTIDKDGNITAGEATDKFTVNTDNDVINVDFGAINQSYRVEFITKDKDGVYNSDEVYENTAKFIPRVGEQHDLWANVTLPNQGEFLGKTGLHNKEEWTADWTIDVNKSKSTLTDVTVRDDLGSTDLQILLEDSIKVTKDGSNEPLVEGEDYKLTVDGNELTVYFLGVITDAYKVTYSSYIVAEDDAEIKNEAEIQSVDEVIVGNTEKTETIHVKISSGGGTGQGETGSLVIEKTEDGTNRILKDVAFELVKTVGNQNIVVREGTTDADGKLEWKGLKFGDYTLKEMIPEGYLGEKEQTVTISSDDPEGIKTLAIKNERQTGTAKIVKVDSVTNETLDGAKFILKNLTTGHQYTFTTEDGVISEEVPFGEYTVEEITAPKGYRITENIPNITIEIDKETEIEVENVAFVDVEGLKNWVTDDDKELPESIIVKLLADGKEIDEQTIDKDKEWKYSFKNLDKYNKADREIKYEIEEVVVDGYVVEKDGYNLTNIQTTEVSGIKTWIDNDDATGDRPTSITVQVLNDEDVVQEKVVTADNNWNYTFTDLPKYDLEGIEIEYTLNEVAVDGYETKLTDGSYDIENVRKATTSVKGEKTWKDEDPTDRPASIEVELTREVNNEKDGDFSQTETVKPNSKDEWIYEFDNLDEFDENGVAYTYIIKELNVPENYKSTVKGHDIENVRIGKTEVSGTKRWKDDKVTDRPDSIKVNLLLNNIVIDTIEEVTADDDWKYKFTGLDKYDEDGKYYEYKVSEEQVPGYAPQVTDYDITNTRSEKTSFEITKGWLDGDSEDRPESIIVYVYQNDKLFDTVEVKAANDWVYELKDLEAYDNDGQPYTYTVKEKAIDGYESTVDGFNITNLRVGETEVSGTKTWKDNDDATETRPDSITVKLLQNGKEIASQEVTAEDNWEYSFEGLDKYDDQGVAYGYTIDEVDVDGYAKSGNGTDLTNTRTGTTEVTGEKVWQDNDDATGDRPETITVKLLQNGSLFAIQEVTAEDDWEYSFNHLPAFDDNGVAYGYTIDEEDVDGYSKSADGNDLINTRVGETEVSGTKIWQDNDDATETRPESITVKLLQNGKVFATTEVTAETEWTYSFENLPRFDDQGVEWGYTIDEEPVEGYAKSVDGNNLINTRTGITEVSGEKIWKDADESDRPESITVNLLQNGKVFAVEEVTANEEGDWKYSFTDLPEFDENGIAWGYTIDEEPVEGYAKSVDGYDLINTRSEKTDITVTKHWQDEGESTRPDSVTVNLLQNGTVFAVEELTSDSNWEFTFNHLDKYDAEGKAYEYTVTEHDVPGYAVSIDGLDITNTRSDVKDITITKAWLDGNSPDRPDLIEVELFRTVADGKEELVDTYTVTADADWSLEIKDLPSFDSKGKAYTYTVEEKAVKGYETSINGFDITNLRVGETEVTGTKTWLDDNSADRPKSITVNLLANGDKVDEVDVTAESNWTYAFTDLVKYDDQGVEIQYTIDEKDVEGYTKSIDGYDLTNHRTGITEVPVTKTWKDDKVTDRPESITVDLLRNGDKIDTAKLTAEMDWKFTFSDLPEFDENGKAYQYTVEEHDVDGYTTTVDGFNITNTLVPKPDNGDKDPTVPTEDPKDPVDPTVPKDPQDPEKPSGDDSGDGKEIPKTATDIYNLLLIGFGLLLVGLLTLFIRKRREV